MVLFAKDDWNAGVSSLTAGKNGAVNQLDYSDFLGILEYALTMRAMCIGNALTPEEKAKSPTACESNTLPHTVVSLALNTALRKHEIRLLRWSEMDLFNRTLTVGRTKTEGGSGRVVPRNAVAYTAQVSWGGMLPETQPEHHIFPSPEYARIDTKHPSVTNNIDWKQRSGLGGLLGGEHWKIPGYTLDSMICATAALRSSPRVMPASRLSWLLRET
jgi:integrase